ncbi:MAG: hypothetical protein NVV72_18620 [Asticcacaulis sp.]|nr:hypothetical protein [Asticcacaulis sp.]
MTRSANFTPYILAAFFAAVLLALVAASAWSHEQADRFAQANADATDVPSDEEAPVTDAVIEAVN